MGHHLLFQFISIHELTYSPILYDAVRIAGGDPVSFHRPLDRTPLT